MKAQLAPIPAEGLDTRLSAAGFHVHPVVNSPPGTVSYELRHHRDPEYAVRVHFLDGSVSVLALRITGDSGIATLFDVPNVSRVGTVEEVLDRVIETVQGAYAAINRRRFAAGLSTQAHEVSVRTKRSDLRRRSG